MILAFDTSAAHCAAALVSGDRVWRRSEPMQRGHAERLMPMIAEIMAEAGAGWPDLAVVAVSTGPGSFTGIRVGVAAARGIALGRAIPAVGISRFEALAHGQGAVTVILEGRGGGGYAQSFGADGQPLDQPRAGHLAALRAAVTGPVIGEGPADPAVIAEIAAGRLGAACPPPAPLYLRPADAAPSADLPPVLLP